MKFQTSKLTGIALDWAVLQAERSPFSSLSGFKRYHRSGGANYSTSWAQGGPLVERQKICVSIASAGVWVACSRYNHLDEPRCMVAGATALEAAMRCYVTQTLGPGIELPDRIFSR